ncbi:MAG: hypothetical protein M3Z21_08820 [Pseudomonadota bacterium]|nr:hypothetical protein [Pseudomonadota bacterium]
MNSDPTPIDDLPALRQAAIDLIQTAGVCLHFYSPEVDPRLYDDPQLLDALRSRISGTPRLGVYMLLPAADAWHHACPRLVSTAQRLTTNLELRTVARETVHDRAQFERAFIIADRTDLIHQADPRRFIGSYRTRDPAQAAHLLAFFTDAWNRSQPDPELRLLRI